MFKCLNFVRYLIRYFNNCPVSFFVFVHFVAIEWITLFLIFGDLSPPSLLHHFFVLSKMNRPEAFITTGLLIFVLTACDEQQQPVFQEENITQATTSYHCTYSDNTSKNCKCPIQFELNDSSTLTHIKGEFYKSETGHLYEKTWADRELKGQDRLSSVLYFNGCLSQEIDPLTFEPLDDSWYAKDKNYVYYYRPMSGGMQISIINSADASTFKLLPGHYKYAVDKNAFYNETKIIEGFLPAKTKQKLDNKGRVCEMTCNNKNYDFELVN